MLLLGGYSSSVVVCHFSGFSVYNGVEFCSIQRERRASMSVLYQYLGPSLMLHSIAAGLWEYSLDGSFGIFTIAASVFGHCLIFCRQIIIFFQILPPGVQY